MESFICVTCGVQFAPSEEPPPRCPICDDERQYINEKGQRWTTLAEMRGSYRNTIQEIEPGMTGFVTEPAFAIGQEARLIQTSNGNILWECLSQIDDETIARIRSLGGVAAIGISHPHFFSSMIEWSRAFADAPIFLHSSNAEYVMRPDDAIRFWDGDQFEPLPGLLIIRCGGHFPGSSVLHWPEGADGRGALLTGDTIYVVQDRRWVSFMYSYPNLIPLNERAVRGIVQAVEPVQFDRLYAAWRGRVVAEGAKDAVRRSADRYVSRIAG